MSESPEASACDSSTAASALGRFLDTLVPAKFETDAALAKAIGVDRSLLPRWRQGTIPNPASLYGLARAAGVSVEYLITVIGYEKWAADQKQDKDG